MLCRQLSALKDLIPIDLQEEYSQCCNKLPSMDPVAFEYILKVLKDISGQELLPKDTLFLLLTCLQQFFGEEGIQDLSETAQRGCLWVNMGLLQIQMWLPQTRFDPAVKRECKLKYSKDEVSMELVSLLLTRGFVTQCLWNFFLMREARIFSYIFYWINCIAGTPD